MLLCTGYCKDFADELKEYLRTEYVLVPVADGEFGKELPNKTWTGIIGELRRGVSSLHHTFRLLLKQITQFHYTDPLFTFLSFSFFVFVPFFFFFRIVQRYMSVVYHCSLSATHIWNGTVLAAEFPFFLLQEWYCVHLCKNVCL